MHYPSVADRVDEHTPPTFLFAIREDEIVPISHTLAFASALKTAGIPFEMHIFQKRRHGLSLGKALSANGHGFALNAAFSQWLPLSIVWLKGSWGDFPTD